MAAEEVQTVLSSVEIDEDRFVGLLTKLIDNVATLQNNPTQVSSRCVFSPNRRSKICARPSAFATAVNQTH